MSQNRKPTYTQCVILGWTAELEQRAIQWQQEKQEKNQPRK